MEGRIGISRRTSTGTEGVMCIEIADVSSGTGFLEIEISLKDWALAISGLHGVPIDFTTRGLDLIGLVHEYKKELIQIPDDLGYDRNNAQANELLAPYTVDGWKGNIADLFNHHNSERDDNNIQFQSVGFHRHVKKK